MRKFEYVALAEKGIIESTFEIQPNAHGTFTFTAIQKYPHKKDKIVQMRFNKFGLIAIIGMLRYLDLESQEDD
ncbi:MULTISPECIES: hypothetical protein [Lentilactobacillus]|uniref:hypothetical protein n=1 Tax=Lentilactobacillus TaxID=2767893 RepID=UPI00080BB8EE|nr:hypothetical protein [Lentilactobacillus parabuchneri]MBW0222318.1 hypothetical protein [Lentilactobacillus parabuchneri]OCB81754.1 hypothetical protein A8O18_00020 [Lentilactobacillus parabuchneri]OCB82413.1 hypothetical protein A7322_00015 [Lentilactobacillus parabuchneri]